MEDTEELCVDFILELLYSIQDHNDKCGMRTCNNESSECDTYWMDKGVLRDNILITIEEFEYDVYETLEKYKRSISVESAREIKAWLKENYKD